MVNQPVGRRRGVHGVRHYSALKDVIDDKPRSSKTTVNPLARSRHSGYPPDFRRIWSDQNKTDVWQSRHDVLPSVLAERLLPDLTPRPDGFLGPAARTQRVSGRTRGRSGPSRTGCSLRGQLAAPFPNLKTSLPPSISGEHGFPRNETAALRWLEQYLVENSPKLQHFAEITASLANREPLDRRRTPVARCSPCGSRSGSPRRADRRRQARLSPTLRLCSNEQWIDSDAWQDIAHVINP